MNRWGFLGTGRVTRRMIDAVRQANEASLAGIASREHERAKAWAEDRGTELNHPDAEEVKAYRNYDAMLQDPSIDWVYVALPPSLHCQWTMAALIAGKNVLCEKPLCQNSHEAIEIANTAKKYNRQVFHATAFPYHPRSAAARALIAAGELGEIRRLHVACTFAGVLNRGNDHRTDAALGGGCLLDLGWYCVLSTLWFTGLECTRLRAVGSKAGGVWNQVQVLAEMNNGAIAHWDCGFDAAPRRWIEIAGIQASWICDDFLRPLDIAKPRFWVHGQDGKARTETIGEGIFQEAFMIEACQASQPSKNDSTLKSIATQKIAADQFALALKTHRILDCIEQSAESGEAVRV